MSLLVLVVSLGFLCGASAARSAVPVHSDPLLEARVDSLLRSSSSQIYAGRIDLARDAVDEAERLAPHDPRIGLFRFRILRVNYPDHVHEKERAKEQQPTLMAELDASIAESEAMLKVDSDSVAGYLYRGWAHMMKAQTLAIAGDYWAAGRESKKGKKDLDRFLKRQPEGDPDAEAILGGYLYFADILPGLVKFLKWIIRIPGGDKDLGLEMLQHATRADGYTKTDSELILGVIYYLFEGRVKEAATIFDRLGRQFPWHPRIVELRGSTSLLYPESTLEAIALETRVIDQWDERIAGWDDLFLHRLRWSRARLMHQAGFYEEAMRELRAVAAEAPRHPYWITPRSLLSLADLEISIGRRDSVAGLCREFLADDSRERFHELASAICGRQPDERQIAVFRELGPARQALYAGDTARTRYLLDRIIIRYGDDVRLRFFEAELERQQKRFDEAERAYRQVVADAAGAGLEPLRMVALLRLGEMNIERQEFTAAQVTYTEACKMEPSATMLGNMIRGRLRYIEEQVD